MPKDETEITPEIFNHLVDLAEFELDEDQAKYLLKELNSQLSAICQLENIQLEEDLYPSSHGVPYPPERKPDLRADERRPFTDYEAIMDQAPKSKDGFFVVPDIPHTTLE